MVDYNTIVLVAPWMDVATTVSSSTAYRISELCKKHGYNVVEIYSVASFNASFISIIALRDPFMIIYTGHGLKDKWIGDDQFVGTLLEQQAHILKDRCVIAVPSCFTAESLGRSAIKEGARYYIGALEEVWVAFNDNHRNYQTIFETSWFIIFSVILKGDSPRNALIEYRKFCMEIVELFETENIGNDNYYKDFMIKNMNTIRGLASNTEHSNLDIRIPPPIPYDPSYITEEYSIDGKIIN